LRALTVRALQNENANFTSRAVKSAFELLIDAIDARLLPGEVAADLIPRGPPEITDRPTLEKEFGIKGNRSADEVIAKIDEIYKSYNVYSETDSKTVEFWTEKRGAIDKLYGIELESYDRSTVKNTIVNLIKAIEQYRKRKEERNDHEMTVADGARQNEEAEQKRIAEDAEREQKRIAEDAIRDAKEAEDKQKRIAEEKERLAKEAEDKQKRIAEEKERLAKEAALEQKRFAEEAERLAKEAKRQSDEIIAARLTKEREKANLEALERATAQAAAQLEEAAQAAARAAARAAEDARAQAAQSEEDARAQAAQASQAEEAARAQAEASQEEITQSRMDADRLREVAKNAQTDADIARTGEQFARSIVGAAGGTSLPSILSEVMKLANKIFRLVKIKRDEWKTSVSNKDLKEVYDKVMEYQAKYAEINGADRVMAGYRDMQRLATQRLNQLNDEFSLLVKTSNFNNSVNVPFVMGGRRRFVGENEITNVL